MKKGTSAQEFQWESRKGLKSSVYSMCMFRFFIPKITKQLAKANCSVKRKNLIKTGLSFQ
ncbi:hypothetical protein COK81_31205 [Bacillus thuringiensis]|uniref:Uncharacterized protein n=1 Tax=Bacillus thuringiensis TaxID=1428 RepID=A0A9X7AVJ0_BACTU|nr:hypothetical protein COK81_31205 [Bacillus thuringiensis]